MNVRSLAMPAWRPLRHAVVASFGWRRVVTAASLAVVAAAVLNPWFKVDFWIVLGRVVLVAAMLLLAFGVAGAAWRSRAVPRWVAQLVAVAITAPIATLIAYLPSTGGSIAEILAHEGRVLGVLFISGTALFIAPLLALAALHRERDTQSRADALAFALEKSTLEREAVDARLQLLQAQIEPHFLFNTLANVQALVESGSPQAAPVLKSLIAYLRAALPRLHDPAAATLGRELALVRAYLELMQMRMPDRLQWSIDVAPGLESVDLVPMSVLMLVENAIRHGIDPSEGGGRIDIAARRDGPSGPLRIRVSDTGLGMNEKAVPGTGLANLTARLKSRHGDSARLEMHAVVPHGVRAEIVVDDPVPAAQPVSSPPPT